MRNVIKILGGLISTYISVQILILSITYPNTMFLIIFIPSVLFYIIFNIMWKKSINRINKEL